MILFPVFPSLSPFPHLLRSLGYSRDDRGEGGFRRDDRGEGGDRREGGFRREERREEPPRFDTSGGNWRDEKREPRPPRFEGRFGGREEEGGERSERRFERREGGGGDRQDGGVRETYEHRGYQIDRNARPLKTEVPTQGPFKIFLGNVSFRITDNDIRDLFSGLPVVSIHLPKDQMNRLRGFGYVEFESVDDLKTAIEMNGAIVLDRPVHIDVATPSERPERRKTARGFSLLPSLAHLSFFFLPSSFIFFLREPW